MNSPEARQQSKLPIKKNPSPQWSDSDLRRLFAGFLCVACLAIGGLQTWLFGTSEDWGRSFFLRTGLVLGVLWIAWPSLQRPARWLPPGMLVVFMIGFAALLVQPKVASIVIPAFVLLTTIAGILTWFRR